jgi:hypothetical protein
MQPCADWLKKQEVSVSAADWLFESCPSLFDAMPAMRKNLSKVPHGEVLQLVDSMEMTGCIADSNTCSLWTINNVRKVMRLGYIVYKDVHKLRACLVVAKEDPTVFLDPSAPVVVTKDSSKYT